MPTALSPALSTPPVSTTKSSAPPVYVVVGADREHWPGVVGVVNSVMANSAQASRLRILALAETELRTTTTTRMLLRGLQTKMMTPRNANA